MENKPIFSNQICYLNASTSSQASYLYKPHELSRPPSVPVLGRKLSNESIITLRDESISRYPYAVNPVPHKALNSKLHPKLIQNLPKCKSKATKTQENCKSRSTSPLSKVKTAKTSRTARAKPTAIKTHRPATKVATNLKPPKTPEKKHQVQIKEIVEKSLKKQKNLKKNHEKAEKLKNDVKEKIKKNIQELNQVAREENLKNFKQKLFNPRQVWGVEKKKEKIGRKQEDILQILSKRTKFNPRSKNVTPEVSPSKRCLSARAKISVKSKNKKKKISRHEKENLRVVQVKLNPEALKRPSKKKTPVKPLKKCPEMKWLDQYLESMSELSNRKSMQSENQSKIPEFGIVDNFELFEENSQVAVEPKLKYIEKISVPQNFESFSMEDSGLLSEFLLEENSKIVRLKKINKQKNEEIQEKIVKAKAKIEEKYLNEKLSKFFQAAAKGWLVRKEFEDLNEKYEESEASQDSEEITSQVGKNDDSKSFIKVSPKFEGNLENSWIYKRQYPEESDSFLNDEEEVNSILKAFKIKTDKIKGINEKSLELKSKYFNLASIESLSSAGSKPSTQPTPAPKLIEKSNQSIRDSNENKNKSIEKSKALPRSRNLSSEEEPKGEIISLAPISKGHNLNLNEITHRLLQEQHNLDILEVESKEMLKIMSPQSPKLPKQLKMLNISPELSSEAEILSLFQEIIVKKYSSLYLVLEKNIQVLKDALADSLSSKSKTESMELKKKLQRISTEESSEDLDQILKDLIGTQDIYKIEVEVLQDFINSFPGSRSSPVPSILSQCASHPTLAPENFEIPIFRSEYNLEEIPSQDSSVQEPEPLDLLDTYLNKIEDQLITSIFLNSVQDQIVDFSEDLLMSLVETEAILINHEFKMALSDHSLHHFSDQVMNRFKPIIMSELAEFRQDDPLDLLAMMQESEIGSGHFPEILFAVIDPKLFLDIIQEDPLFVCIFKKMAFDCINENLNKFISKLPTPWGDGRMIRKNSEFFNIFQEIDKKLSICNQFRMGKIFTSEETEMGIIRTREEKIMKVINYENNEGEYKWVDYGFEESQVKLDLADMMLESLVEEAIEISIKK